MTRERQTRAKHAKPAAGLALAGVLLLAGMPAWAGTLTGRFVLPSTGAVVNGTLLLSLSQAAVVPGSYAVVPASIACATSSDGSVVGVGNPLAAPAGVATPGAGTLAAGLYVAEIVYTGAGTTSSLPSPELSLTLSAPGALTIEPPANAPAAATGYAVYLGSASGAETLQGTSALNTSFVQTAPLASGAAPPSLNTTVCSPAFNDTLIPSFTYYQATLEDAAGDVLAGYPQSWYLAGSSVDVSEIEPLVSNPAVRFPMPVLQNPPQATAQSVASGLNLNGYDLSAAGNVGPGFFSSFWSGALPGANTTLGAWTPNTAVTLRRLDLNAQTAGAGGTAGATIEISDGTSTCTFSGLLAGAASSGSATATGNCSFGAGVALTVRLTGDDHTTAPVNLSWAIEMTAR